MDLTTLNWLNAFVFFLLIAGHTAFWVAYVNRSHALPISCDRLHHLRRAHDIALPVFPIALVVWPGYFAPGLLVNSQAAWSQLSLPWVAYLSVCGLGTVGLAWRIFQWQTRRPPHCLVAQSSDMHDISAMSQQPLAGSGPHAGMTRLRFNEQFQLEINRKTFQLPSLPTAWSPGQGLRVLHLSDFHFIGSPDKSWYQHCLQLATAEEFDIVLFTGDLMDDTALLDWVPDILGHVSAPLGCFYILGNHDWNIEVSPIRAALDALGWRDVAGGTHVVQHQGVDVVLGGTERPWMGRHPDFAAAEATGTSAVRILLSHTPDHIGWAQRQSVPIMLSGHNHGGQVILPVIGPVYSPSFYGVKYSHGDFHERGTLLCISRGLAGRHPLRWNCRPEICTLTFECSEASYSRDRVS